MDSLHVRQRLRPSSYAFIVTSGNLSLVSEAASLNAAIWGGIFNPIVPLEPTDHRDGLLRCFDTDYVVNLTERELPSDLSARYESRLVSRSDLVHSDHLTNQRSLALGFDISGLIGHVHERELRFSNAPSRAALLRSGSDGWSEFIAVAYGSFQYLPELDVPFERMFLEGLRAREIELPAVGPPPDYGNLLSPLDFTRYGLRVIPRQGSCSTHIIFIGDHRAPGDLVEFWNIRATDRDTVFIPVDQYKEFEPVIRVIADEGQYQINQELKNHVDLQKGSSVPDDVFKNVFDWIKTLELGEIWGRNWQPRFGVEHHPLYVGDIHSAQLIASESDDLSILHGESMTPVKPVKPPFLPESTRGRGQRKWSIDISVSGLSSDLDYTFSFPNEPGLQTIARRSVLGSADEVRIGYSGLVLLRDEMSFSRIHFMPVKSVNVFQALFRQAGLEITPSQPGRYASQIIKKMGSLHGDCRIFKVRGVRDVLDKLDSGSTLRKGNIHQIVMCKVADEHGTNWRPDLYNGVVHNFQAGGSFDFHFDTAFDILLSKRIIRPGFVLQCRNCYKEEWYHVSEFDEEYTCRFCFLQQRVDFANKRDWQYKSDGLFRIPDSAQGSVAVVLSLWRFDHLTHRRNGYYMTSHNVSAADNSLDCEVDYAYLFIDDLDGTYEIVVGQATRFGDFNDGDMQKMSTLADKLPRKPYIAFSTLKDRFSDADKTRLRSLVDAGYKVIAFTREELDPYDLHDRFAAAPHRYGHDLRELSENTLALNVFN